MNKSIIYLVLFTFGLSIYSFNASKEEKDFKKSLETFILTNDAPSKKNPEIHKKTVNGETYTTETYYDKSNFAPGAVTWDAWREIYYHNPHNPFGASTILLSNDVKLIDYSILDKRYIEQLENLLTQKIKKADLQGLVFFGSTSKIDIDRRKTLTIKFSYKSGLDKTVKNYIKNKDWQALQDFLIQHMPTIRLKIRSGFKITEPNYHVLGIERMLEHIVHKLKG